MPAPAPHPSGFVTPTPAGPHRARALPRDIAFSRAGAAVLWAAAYFVALHGQRVLSGADIPIVVGLLISAYPVIDAVALLTEGRLSAGRRELWVGALLDGVAIIALLVATLALHTGAVLAVFGAWALLSGTLMLPAAWRADRSRRVQLPLLISGGISAVAGITFITMASQFAARLSNLGMYALLGAAFFFVWTFLNRKVDVRTGPNQAAVQS